ncbi:hypothetical protein [Alicyclobacillus ferrooxydans]|uniref:Uncharacterized protein n=1 Tax=Alicyclobacillus ferrooxydans TaxID=471514 RepID=A0A0P9D0P5_9BACL|nr:hypothetical protein [Alicyclobacillus ferrooxydans]KPV45638.1 hypothetical protein AN477_01620 [Alicyclobacillus ferrooxydans]
MRLSPKFRMVAVGALACLAVVFGDISYAFAYISRGWSPASTAGYSANTQYGMMIQGGTDFQVLQSSEPALTGMGQADLFRYGADGIHIIGGTDSLGGIWHFDRVSHNGISIDSDNGYLEVDDNISTIDQWIAALNGNQSYVTSQLWHTTWGDRAGDRFNTASISQIVDESGGKFAPNASNYNDTVYATQPPKAEVGVVGSTQTVQQGQLVEFYNHAFIEGYHSNYHFEYVEVTNSNGRNVTSQAFAESSLQGRAPYNGETLYTSNGAVMVEVNGGGPTSQPPTYVETVDGGDAQPNIIHTSNLVPGRYTITLYVKDWFNRSASAATATFTVTRGKNPPPPPGGNPPQPPSGGRGGGASCPPPSIPSKPANQVLSYNWAPDGAGGQILTWTDTNWLLETITDSNGCVMYEWVDEPKTYSHDYPLSVSNHEITGLFYDPGRPGDLWSPTNTTASQVNNDGYLDGSTVAGNPSLPTYGNPNGTPVVYTRVGGGFSFRLMWTGSPHDMPDRAEVAYHLVNPDGETRGWDKSFDLLPQTIFNQGDVPVWDSYGNGYPPPATEYGWAYTSIPKYASPGTPSSYSELTAWNLTGASSGAAHIRADVTFTTGTGSTVTWHHPDLAQMLGYPTWYYIHEIPDPNARYEQNQPNYTRNSTYSFPQIQANGQLLPAYHTPAP